MADFNHTIKSLSGTFGDQLARKIRLDRLPVVGERFSCLRLREDENGNQILGTFGPTSIITKVEVIGDSIVFETQNSRYLIEPCFNPTKGKNTTEMLDRLKSNEEVQDIYQQRYGINNLGDKVSDITNQIEESDGMRLNSVSLLSDGSYVINYSLKCEQPAEEIE